MNKFFEKCQLDKLSLAMGNNVLIASLRRGMNFSIPFFLFGSLALVILNLPIEGYDVFIKNLWGGSIYIACMFVYHATMEVMSLILILTVSYSYGQIVDAHHGGFYSITSMVCYMIFVIQHDMTKNIETFGPNWMFTAVLITMFSCAILRKLFKVSQTYRDTHYQEGIDLDFQNVMLSLFPIAGCILCVILLKALIVWGFGSTDIQNVGSVFFYSLFEKVGTGIGGAILFVIIAHVLWFFGLHGSNMMHIVSDGIFEKNIEANMLAVEMGEVPTEIFSKTFYDCFVLLGGSGATLCLLAALLLLGSKQRSSSKNLFRFSLVPGIFNINEIVLFGLPVVFNPIMFIPFVMVPIVLLCISGLATYLGLVPVCVEKVQWTTPMILSGYLSTGSVAGSLLQIFNLCVGTAIYIPFVRISEKYYSDLLEKGVRNLKETIINREETGTTISLKSPEYHKLQDVLKLLIADLHHALNYGKISLYYQPQFRADGTLYGVEALLRWKHGSLGYLYPPMVIELAREDGVLQKMGYKIIESASWALERISQEVSYPIHMAVNISPDQLEDSKFCENVKEIIAKHDFHGCTMCFEITEQITLASTRIIENRISELRAMGIQFHVDDFGMGHSSMVYLQKNEFAAVKIDGSLIRDLVENTRAQEIISSIAQISEPLNYDLIAEYVETEEQKAILKKLGCEIYQGYLYNQALPIEKLESYLEKQKIIDKPLGTVYKEGEKHL